MHKIRRTVVMEICIPVAVRFTVEATRGPDNDDIDDLDWEIVKVEDNDNFMKAGSVREVTEQMTGEDFEELNRLARLAAKEP